MPTSGLTITRVDLQSETAETKSSTAGAIVPRGRSQAAASSSIPVSQVPRSSTIVVPPQG
ncbi:unannotated protein [freshwater metagenome]|uniref:Unannotated protein n=1 Tax=freshwater metagenome TaxID=449393 RepID=A0A6J7ETV2_9ZZZZ